MINIYKKISYWSFAVRVTKHNILFYRL